MENAVGGTAEQQAALLVICHPRGQSKAKSNSPIITWRTGAAMCSTHLTHKAADAFHSGERFFIKVQLLFVLFVQKGCAVGMLLLIGYRAGVSKMVSF